MKKEIRDKLQEVLQDACKEAETNEELWDVMDAAHILMSYGVSICDKPLLDDVFTSIADCFKPINI